MTGSREPDRDELERRLRASLQRHASETPDSGLLAERIIHAADRPAGVARRTRHRAWAMPVTIAAVVLVLAGVVVGVSTLARPGTHRGPVAASQRATPSSSPSTHVYAPDSPAPTTASPSTADTGPAQLHDVTILDLTFDSPESGWALASAKCLNRPASRCTALEHTSDGSTWSSRGGEAFNVAGVNGCASPCVDSIRFANSSFGYAFGPSAFFTTTDGGATFTRQSGGALALESADNNVIRVVPATGGIGVETAPNGSTNWTPASLPGGGQVTGSFSVHLVRAGTDAYLLVSTPDAPARTVLYRSSDDGAHWASSGEPCPTAGSYAIDATAGNDGAAGVLCVSTRGSSRTLAVSGDAGAEFASRGPALGASASQLTGDPAGLLLVAGSDLQRSTNGGRSFDVVPGIGAPYSFIGFETTTIGRVVSGDDTIWTTRNGGATWTDTQLG